MTINKPQALPNANRNYVFGLGSLLWRENDETQWHDVGNVKEMGLTSEVEEAEAENTRGQVRRIAKTVVTKIKMTANAVINYASLPNLILFLMGSQDSDQTQSAGAWENDFSVTLADIPALGTVMDLPGYGDVSNIVVKKGETTLTLTDTYTVDAVNGTITVKSDNSQGVVATDTLVVTGDNEIDIEVKGKDDQWHDLGKKGFLTVSCDNDGTPLVADADFFVDPDQGQILFTGANVAVGDDITIEATWASKSWKKIFGATTRQRRVHIWYKGDPMSGNIQNVKGYAMLKPSGDLSLIGSEAQEFSLDMTFEDHANYLPGLVVFEDHGSSD